MHPVISAQHIFKHYSGHTALNDVSIDIHPQCIFGLLGPNGAGKTSLIRIINQITAPDKGTIYFNGEKLNPTHNSQIGYLPEERGLYKKMNITEQALYLAQLKGLKKNEAQKRLKYWLEKLELEAWKNKRIEELSKGMQQKVQFIITVIHQPQLLILDEPFSGFDPINANIIKNEILALKKEGATILFSTHNMDSVEELCDHIALLNKSEKILDGSVKDIRKQYRTNRYELIFKGNLIGFSNSLWTYAKLVEHSKVEDHYIAKVELSNNAHANDMLQSVLKAVELLSFKEIIPRMNDIFIANIQIQSKSALSNVPVSQI